MYTTLIQELVHLAVDSEEFRKILSGNAEICSLAIDMMDCRDTVVNQNSSKQDSPSNKEESSPSNEEESGSGSPSNKEESGSGSPSNEEESGSGSPSNKEESGSGSPSNKEESGSGSPSNKEESGSGSPSNKEESDSDDPSNKEESDSGISPQSATEAISTHTPALREKVNQLFTLEQVLDAMEKAISKLDRDKAHNMPAAKEAGISEQSPQSLTTPTLWARPSKPTNTPTLATTPPSTSTPPATPSTTPTSHMPQAVGTNDSLTVGNENEADILDLIEKTLQLMERVNNRNGTDRSGDAMTSSSETTSMEKTAEMYKSDVPKPTVASSLPTDATDSSTEMMVNGQEVIDEIRDALDRIRRTDG